MPVLKEDEWSKILNNVSIISFLQGLNIGGKIYNGHAIITNNKNKETVNEDSIYIVQMDSPHNITYHRPIATGWNENEHYHGYSPGSEDAEAINKRDFKGILNIDFERRMYIDKEKNTKYYFPHSQIGCYYCIVTQTNVEKDEDLVGDLIKYISDKKPRKIAEAYFTALGRERYGLYRTNVNPDEIKLKFGVAK